MDTRGTATDRIHVQSQTHKTIFDALPYQNMVHKNKNIHMENIHIYIYDLHRKAATDKLTEKIVAHDNWPIHYDITNPLHACLPSRKP